MGQNWLKYWVCVWYFCKLVSPSGRIYVCTTLKTIIYLLPKYALLLHERTVSMRRFFYIPIQCRLVLNVENNLEISSALWFGCMPGSKIKVRNGELFFYYFSTNKTCVVDTKYQGSRPCDFRQEDLYMISLYKPMFNMWPQDGPVLAIEA